MRRDRSSQGIPCSKVYQRRLAVPVFHSCQESCHECCVGRGRMDWRGNRYHSVRSSRHVLKSDRQPAAPPLDVLESANGYESLRQVLEHLVEREPRTRFRVRIDAAGQHATNLESFLRSLSLPLEISTGEPSRNSAYRKAHHPKSKTDDVDSRAQARYVVVENPTATPGTPLAFLSLREVVSQLVTQSKQTTRLVNQLHNLLVRVFPELATVVAKVRSPWVLALLDRYPTPALLARARAQSLANIPYLRQEKALQLQQVARRTVGTLQGEVAETLVRETLREIVLSRSIEKRLHRLMRTVFHSLPDGPHRLLTTIAGIGDATAAAIVEKVVSIDRFTPPEHPEPNTSGFDRRGNPVPPGTMHMSRQGNDLVRRYLWMAAQSATLHNAPGASCSRGRKHAASEATYRWDTACGSCCTRCSPCGQLAGHLMQTMSRTVTRLATPMRRATLRRRINLKKHKRLRAIPRSGLKDQWSPQPIPK